MPSGAIRIGCLIFALLPTAGCGGPSAEETQRTAVDRCLRQAKDYCQEGQNDRAVAAYDEAIRLDPNCAVAYINRGGIHAQQGNPQRAVADYAEAARLDSKYADALFRLGYSWFQNRRYADSIAAYDRALQLDPQRPDARAHFFRGNAHDKLGDYEKAVADYDKSVALEPEYALPYFSLAQLRASCPEAAFRCGAKAVANATKACELTDWKNWQVVDALAAAWAEAGDFQNALKWQAKAIEMARQADRRQKKFLQQRLELYRAGKPYRR